MIKINNKEVRNKIKLKRIELFQEKCETNPRALKGRDVIRKAWLLLIVMRMVVVVVELILMVRFQIPTMYIVIEIFTILVMVGYANIMITFGLKQGAYVGLVGGLMSLVPLANGSILELLQFDLIEIKVFLIIGIIIILGQMIAMFYLLVSQDAKAYFEVQPETMKDLNDYALELNKQNTVKD